MSEKIARDIKDAMITLGIEGKEMYSLGELEAVATVAGYPMIAVMGYLRNRQKGAR